MCSLMGSLHSTHPGRASKISSCHQRPSPDAGRTAERTAASWPCGQRLPRPTRSSLSSARPPTNNRLLEALPLAFPVHPAAYLPNVFDAGHCKTMWWLTASRDHNRLSTQGTEGEPRTGRSAWTHPDKVAEVAGTRRSQICPWPRTTLGKQAASALYSLSVSH